MSRVSRMLVAVLTVAVGLSSLLGVSGPDVQRPQPVVASAATRGPGFRIVYSRCARTERTSPVTATVIVQGKPISVTKTLSHTDVLDALPDVTNFFGGFSVPCDLMLLELDGSERVLYDCASRSTEASTCAALDAAASFDGRRSHSRCSGGRSSVVRWRSFLNSFTRTRPRGQVSGPDTQRVPACPRGSAPLRGRSQRCGDRPPPHPQGL